MSRLPNIKTAVMVVDLIKALEWTRDAEVAEARAKTREYKHALVRYVEEAKRYVRKRNLMR
jgi:hypothetical protein